jgi:O-antigen ligase
MIGVGLIFTAVWLTRLIFRTAVFTRVKEYDLLLALSAVVVVSAVVRLDGPAGFSATLTYLQLLLLFILVINLTTTSSRLDTVTGIIIVSSSVLAALILMDQFGWLPAELIPKQTTVIVTESMVRISRSAGLWGDANFTALQLTIALPFIVEWWPAVSLSKRALLLAAGGAILAAFFGTFSMGGLLGLSIMLLIKMLTVSRRDRLFFIARNSLIGISALSAFILFAPDSFVLRVVVTAQSTVGALSTPDQAALLTIGTNRGDTWWAALQAIAASPLLGYGPGNAAYANASYSVIRFTNVLSSHNMLLGAAGELGLVGLALFGALFIAALRAVQSPPDAAAIESNLQRNCRALYIALIGYAAQGMALEIHDLKLLWILLGMAIAAGQLSHHSTISDARVTR